MQNNNIVDSGGWLKMKLLNPNFLRKITIAKGDRLAYLFALNSTGKSQLCKLHKILIYLHK